MAEKKQKVKVVKAEKLSEKDNENIRGIAEVIESKEVATNDAFGKLSRSQIELIKRTIAKGASDDELNMFIQVCKGAKLNPFLNQVFLVPRWDSREGKEVRTIQVSIDGFRSIAEDSKCYAGNDDPKFEGEQEIKLEKFSFVAPLKATVKVYKMVKGLKCSFTATARWSEYYPGVKIGFQWHKRPYLMLGKCAESLVLRKAFPKLLSGMYSPEEMEKGSSETIKTEENQKAFGDLGRAVNRSSLKELNMLKDKMNKSDKYTKEQKVEFSEMIQVRTEELKG